MLHARALLAIIVPLLFCCNSNVWEVGNPDLTDGGSSEDLAFNRTRLVTCMPSSLDRLNKTDFIGAPNGRVSEGACDLEFDEVCNAFAVTWISGQDYLRQLSSNGHLTEWNGTTNLNMGQVAVLRLPLDEFLTQDGEVFLTYNCCNTCGCIEDGKDQRQGIVRLDRKDNIRPLPNVLPAKPTEGNGPFGLPGFDTGPYGPTWGADRSLYVGNVSQNGDLVRVDRTSLEQKTVALFPSRVTAATIYEFNSILVATEDKIVYKLTTTFNNYNFSEWIKLPGYITSIKKDWFTGRIYAEVNTSPAQILEITPDGRSFVKFQTVPAPGRIAIAPDGYLYHLTHPAWRSGAQDSILRWALPNQSAP